MVRLCKVAVGEHISPTKHRRFGRIDEKLQIIYDVWVLGPKSRNKRYYTEECLNEGFGMYEDAPVYLDHEYDLKKPRSVKDQGGVLKNVRRSRDGVRANLHYNSTPAGKRIFESAKRHPKRSGLSPMHSFDYFKHTNGWEEVVKITEVISVDFVSRPATTNGIWESQMTDKCEEVDGVVEESAMELIVKAAGKAALEGDHALSKKLMKLVEKSDEPEEPEEPPKVGDDAEEGGMMEEQVINLCGLYKFEATEQQFDELLQCDSAKARIAKINKFKKSKAGPRPAATKLVRSQSRLGSEAEQLPNASGAPLMSKGATKAEVEAYFNTQRS